MNIMVLGGCGIQGRAAVFDLCRSPGVKKVICADARMDEALLNDPAARAKAEFRRLDASDPASLAALFAARPDAVIDLLPIAFMENVFAAALAAGVHAVTTNYGHVLEKFHEPAREKGCIFLPECGLDPGIDLVAVGMAIGEFDRVTFLKSYCGGIPEPSACTNALNYKISWNWDMVLRSSMRKGVVVENGRPRTILPEDQHHPDNVHFIQFPNLGKLEAVVNGDAHFYTRLLGIENQVQFAGRYSLRWPGWSAFWHPLKQLGFLSREPVAGLDPPLSPHRFLTEFLGPRLQYEKNEKDLVVMDNQIRGKTDGKEMEIRVRLVMERDLATGLLAMSMGVGYPASIAAQMIARGDVSTPGLLSPALHVPAASFFAELEKRGVVMDISRRVL